MRTESLREHPIVLVDAGVVQVVVVGEVGVMSMDEARSKVESWPRECHTFRPHSSLGERAPSEVAGSGLGGLGAPERCKGQVLTLRVDQFSRAVHLGGEPMRDLYFRDLTGSRMIEKRITASH